MDQKSSPERGSSPQPSAPDRRRQRLAEALRANLKKRKAQVRARAAGDAHEPAPGPADPQNPSGKT